MSETVLKIENLGISFGGLKAVQDLNLSIKKGIIEKKDIANPAGKMYATPPSIYISNNNTVIYIVLIVKNEKLN